MSNAFFPVALIESLESTPIDRVLRDEFESGASSTRRMWPAQYYKRRFTLNTVPLTLGEYRYLRSFYAQRGTFDSFWFRDNAGHGGNVLVRFAAPFAHPRNAVTYQVQLELEEVAPIRSLPEFDELATAAGQSPIFWWDANQEVYQSSAGTIYTEASLWDAAAFNYPAVWQAGALNLGGILSQYQTYDANGTGWARTTSNVSELTGVQPACTLFAIVKQSASAGKQVIMAIGATVAGQALGLVLSAANNYEPWIGGTEVWTGVANTAADTYRSVACVWAAGSNAATLYVNGAPTAAGTNARSLTAGPASFLAAPGGTLKMPAATNNNAAHAMAFAGALTQAQIKAIHNLLSYQYGMATVV